MNRVYVNFKSDALGDNIAWLPYLDEFANKNNVEVISNCYYPSLFNDVYSAKYFLKDDSLPSFDEKIDITIRNREIPLQRTATDALGLPFVERRPLFNFGKLVKIGGRVITFSEFGSNYCKAWNNPIGWTRVISHIHSITYSPMAISKEESELTNVIDYTGKGLHDVCNALYSSSLFIGVSSGLAWLAWVLKVPVIMISGHTLPYFEFQGGNSRISALNFNKNTCVGCYNNNSVNVEWEDVWCPFHKGTLRQHECTYTISPSVIVEKINQIIKSSLKI